ncbi:pina [Cystoisospora suis]|uniref:Pina n=1 Tax=Cystoisospora suis TaxID=483139 RepID=A0A2C6L316_9APIC|nr:pina [Cystoisospora suis]
MESGSEASPPAQGEPPQNGSSAFTPDCREPVAFAVPASVVPRSRSTNAGAAQAEAKTGVEEKEQITSACGLPRVIDLKAAYVYEPPPWALGGPAANTTDALDRAFNNPYFPSLVLEVIRDGVVIEQMPLTGRGWWLLGSLKDQVHVLYEHPFVSRRHLVLQFAARPPFHLYCMDLSSSYGTVCNGVRLTPHEPFLVYKARAREEVSPSQEDDDFVSIPSPPSAAGGGDSPSGLDGTEQESVLIVGGKKNTRRFFVIKRREDGGGPLTPELRMGDPTSSSLPSIEKRRDPAAAAESTQQATGKPGAAARKRRVKLWPESESDTSAKPREKETATCRSEVCLSQVALTDGRVLDGEEGEALLEKLQTSPGRQQEELTGFESVKTKSRRLTGKEPEAAERGQSDSDEETQEQRERRERIEANCEAMMFDEDDDFFDRSRQPSATRTRRAREKSGEVLTEAILRKRIHGLENRLKACVAELASLRGERTEKAHEKSGRSETDGDTASAAAEAATGGVDPLDAFMAGVQTSLAGEERQKVEGNKRAIEAELKEAKRLLSILQS